jgi:hypothetical protein
MGHCHSASARTCGSGCAIAFGEPLLGGNSGLFGPFPAARKTSREVLARLYPFKLAIDARC